MQNSRNCLNVVSNRTDKLVEALGENLFSGKPFDPKIVIIPSSVQKNFLLLSFAHNEAWGVCAAIQFYTIEQFLSFQLLRTGSKKRLLSTVELAFLIEYQLRGILKDTTYHSLYQSVHTYLDAESQKREQRITALSHELSALFSKYATYGLHFLDEWLQKKGWQQDVWRRIFDLEWTYPLEVCGQDFSFPHPIHLFGFSYIPPLFREFFLKMKATFYLSSPSPLFLGDVCSDRERFYVENRDSKKGAAFAERKELDAYLKDPNRLIANFGKLKRSTLSLLENEACSIDERYVEPNPKTLLKYVQDDLFHLRNPQEKRTLEEQDHSLEVHSACSLYREVEILRDHVIRRFQEGTPLREMVVFSTHLQSYLPYIEALFAADEHPLPFVVSDVKRVSGRSFEQGFLHFLSLKESRFEKEEVLKLFSCTSFIEKLGWDERDAELFCSWIRSSQLLWGFNGQHRRELLHSETEVSETGTWEWAFDRMLWGLAMDSPNEERSEIPLSPLNLISLTDAEALGKGIGVIREIRKCFQKMKEVPSKTFAEWMLTLQECAQSFFIETAEHQALFAELQTIRHKLNTLEEPHFTFDGILKGVTALIKGKGRGSPSSNMEAVSFHPLREGNIRPASTIFLLGLQEGAFPRKEQPSPLIDSEFYKKTKAPLVFDADRAFFLEVLMQAQDAIVMSYQKVSEDDGKELHPSLFVQELFSYLDQGYTIASSQEPLKRDLPSKALLIDHTAWGFAEKSSTAPSHLDAAKAFYETPTSQMPSFMDERLSCNEKRDVILLRHLMQCARHPIQYFLNQTLGIYREWPEEQDREFVLSPLEKRKLFKDSLKTPLEEVIKRAEQRGALPMWHIGEVFRQNAIDEIAEYHLMLQGFQLDPSTLFDIEFVEHLKRDEALSESHLLLPALEVKRCDGSHVKIIGKLTGLSPNGMLVDGKANVEEITKVWPAFLVYLLVDCDRLIERKLLFTKDGKEKTVEIEHPEELLAKYIDYFEESSRQMSLFMPRWAEAFLHGDVDDFEQKVGLTEKEVKNRRADPYLQWFFMRENGCDVKAFYTNRVSHIREVMHGVV